MDPGCLHQPGIDPQFVNFKAVVTTCDTGKWFGFTVLSLMDAPRVLYHGILKIDLERANFLQLVPGARFTAYKVLPELGCNEQGEEIIIVDLTGGYHVGQILRSPVGTKNPINIDICSGMGGWHVGGQALGLHFAIHIEHDHHVAEVGSHVTMTRVVDPAWVERCRYKHWTMVMESGITLVADFQDDRCWEKIASQGIELVVASLPCPPWSSLTPQIGLGSAAGQLFKDLANFMDMLQPRMVALENVEGLIRHDHWKLIVEWFSNVGFVVAHQSVDSLEGICPMHRNRASVILLNLNHLQDFVKHSLKDVAVALTPIVHSPSAMAAGAILQNIPEVLNDFTMIDPISEQALCNIDFWPRQWKLDDSCVENRKVKLEARLTSVTKPLPCAVARYGVPEELNPQSLKEFGLVMMLIQHPDLGGKPRWITPLEHLTAMGWPLKKIYIPRQVKLARLVVGNTIAPIHALVTLARAAILRPTLLPEIKRGKNIFDLMMPILGDVPKLSRCEVHFDDDYIWVQLKVAIPHQVTQHRIKETPESDTFSNHGVVEASQSTIAPTEIDPMSTAEDVLEKKRHIPFPIFASLQKRLCVAQPPQQIHDCQLTNSTPSNMIKIKGTPLHECECVFSWEPNAMHTPHVLHEVTHTDGVKHEVLLPDTWITGTVKRGPDNNMHYDNSLTIVDVTGSWKTMIGLPRPTAVGHVIQMVFPKATVGWIQNLKLNQVKCSWDTECFVGILEIHPFKFKKLLLVPELMRAITLYCDLFDTPQQVNGEHPLLKRLSHDIDWIFVEYRTLQAIRMEPDALILDFPFHCWTLRSVDWVPSRALPLRVVKDPQQINQCNLPPIGRVMCVHPFSGKSHEFALAEVTHVIDLLDVLRPPIPPHIDVAAEIDGKRVDLTTRLSDIDLRRVIRFRHFGLCGGAPSMSLVKTELMAHGVPEAQVTSRAKAVITALGEPVAQDIFLKHDPWSAMKTSCKDNQLRLVLPAELKEHQKSMRAASRPRHDSTSTSAASDDGKSQGKGGKGKTPNNGKGKNKGKVVIDFEKQFDNIEFPVEGFVSTSGGNVPWISKQKVVRDSSGICALTLSEAQPFLHLRSFSLDPLALLVLGHDLVISDHVSHIVVPVVLKPDNTPHLIPCSLVQLGDDPVQYEFNGPSVTVTTTPSCVLEVTIEKDRCKHWCELFKPLDLLVQCLPLLRDTKKILSHWSWIWTDSHNKICPVTASCRLHGYLRVPETEVREILQQSGPNGLTVWPKTAEKKVDPKFAHIPLSSTDPNEVQALVQTIPQSIGFVCVDKKYRIRCLREDYGTLRQQLVPQGVIFDASVIQQDDLLVVLSSPVPLSASMQVLTDAIQQTSWTATVVRPLGPSSWLLKANDSPPGPHLSVNDNILSLRPFVADRPKPIVTQFATPKPSHIGKGGPWANYKPTSTAMETPSVGTSMQRIHDVEKDLNAKMEQQMKQLVDTKLQSVEGRIAAIETQNTQFQEACTQRFAQVEQNVNASLQGLQQRIESQGSTIIHQMTELFKTYNKPTDNDAETPKRPRVGEKPDAEL